MDAKPAPDLPRQNATPESLTFPRSPQDWQTAQPTNQPERMPQTPPKTSATSTSGTDYPGRALIAVRRAGLSEYEWTTLSANDLGLKSLPQSATGYELSMSKAVIAINRRDLRDPKAPDHPLQVGRIILNPNGTIQGLESSTDPLMLRHAVEQLRTVPLVAAAAQRAGIQPLSSSEREGIGSQIAALKSETAEAGVIRKELMQLAGRSNQRQLKRVDSHQVLSVGQGEIGETQGKPRYIESIGAGPCIIISSYDPKTQETRLAHIDGLTNLEMTINLLVGSDPRNSSSGRQIRVFGGDSSSINKLIELKRILDARGVKPIEWDILNTTKNIVIDSRDGRSFDVVPEGRGTFSMPDMTPNHPPRWVFPR